jgi:hypothetical protein
MDRGDGRGKFEVWIDDKPPARIHMAYEVDGTD